MVSKIVFAPFCRPNWAQNDMNIRKSFPLIKIINYGLIDLPSPINLSVNWNYGSILGLILVNQLIRGLILATRFSAHISLAFESVVRISQDTTYGWLLRLIHATGARFFILFLYLHIGRGIYYGSFTKTILWNLGVVLYLLTMGTAFLGYVLPWGQMSYWAATVITNLLSVVPVFGGKLVVWVWGGFAVGNPTLTRFFTLHFLLPFVISFLAFIHIYYLHRYGSANPLGTERLSRLSFHYYYSVKDLFLFLILIIIFILFSAIFGYDFIDPENFIPANILVTPIHIQPEWYFLFAYAILRAIPNKLGGVLALLLSILILLIYSWRSYKAIFIGCQFSPITRLSFWSLVTTFGLLTWLGATPAEYPYAGVAQVVSVIYFIFHFIIIHLSQRINYSYSIKNILNCHFKDLIVSVRI